MPRTSRNAPGDMVYHVLNRGNGRRRLFHKPGDYAAFLKLLGQAIDQTPVRVLGFCVMPNHWHLVLWPRHDGELSRFMGWLTTAHVRRYHQHYHTWGQGHIYQGRFKSFPIQDDGHLLTVLRYVEANPLRAKLVDRAQDWQWSSLGLRTVAGRKIDWLTDWPIDRPRDWTVLVNEIQDRSTVESIRTSLLRSRPFGQPDWTLATARKLGLQFTLNPRGRPRKSQKDECPLY